MLTKKDTGQSFTYNSKSFLFSVSIAVYIKYESYGQFLHFSF